MRVNVVTPWYPDYASVFSGIFVKQQVDGLRARGLEVEVEVPRLFPAPRGPVPSEVVAAIVELGNVDAGAMYAQMGSVTWLPVPVPARSGYAGRATAFRECISRKRVALPVEADITHAHLGLPVGWAVKDLSQKPLIVTEHQSTLDQVFSEPNAVEMYRSVIDRADKFFCVSGHLRDQIGEAVGQEAVDRIEILPNIVALDSVSYRHREQSGLRDWVYVGSVAHHKGAQLLLRSFEHYRRVFEPEATLSVVGDGPLLEWVARYARIRGLKEVVDLPGAVPHEEIDSFLTEADVMVHLSRAETFGIASLEGIGAGLPVVSLKNGGADAAWGDVEHQVGKLLELDSSPEDVSRAVHDLAEDRDRLNPAAGRTMVEQRFSTEAVTDRLITSYEACLR